MDPIFIAAKKLIDQSQKILSISHRRPDGDTLGASCALYLALKAMGKEVDMACIDAIPDRFDFLPDMRKVIQSFNFREYDLIIVSDAGASYMTRYHEKYPDIFHGDVPVLNIDHHASNDKFGSCNMIDPLCPSTTLLLYRFFTFFNIPITADIATALMTGIYNDTGSLMHSNTTREVFDACSDLAQKGAKITTIARKMFNTTPFEQLKLWGRILENARINEKGVTVSAVTWRDFQECGASPEAVSGAIDLLNAVPNAQYACLLNEDKNGNVKGSFRTQREDVDVAALAAEFGGGGHKKAAGFTMPGRIHQETHWKIVPTQAEKLEKTKPIPQINTKNSVEQEA